MSLQDFGSPDSQTEADAPLTQDPTLGECLRAAYANSTTIPDAVARQFGNQFQLPAQLVTPRDEKEINESVSQSESAPATQSRQNQSPVGAQIQSQPQTQTSLTTPPRSTPVYTQQSPQSQASPQSLSQQSPLLSQTSPLSFNPADSFLSPNQSSINTDANSSWLPPEESPNQDYMSSNPPKARIHQQPGQYQMPLSYNGPPQNQNPNQGLNINEGRFHNMNPQMYETRQNRNPQNPPNQPTASSMENTNRSIIPTPHANDQRYSDITEFLNMPQNQAAKRLGIPPSTLSKRWREAAPNRKWPYRTVCKIDKEITTLLHNIPQDGVIPPDIEKKLSALIAKRQEELKTIVVRL
uniref:RWP-RK domain-containing protein n=1 Tax=Vannella robusta TaxID=1487602 RepID=A0A7S4IIK0_9EUKA|mmetsp:Transcript_3047/g.3755  ORF Transcript_3047/g.3755 Transcript_3047/m.3755 type:complete len:353 (+) Transcript_3047:51-1109(+)